MTMPRTAAAAALLLLIAPASPAAVIRVPQDQPTIQAGIDAAVDGDTVLVGPGTYFDPIDFLGKEIIVRSSDGPEQTIIDGSGHEEHAVTFADGEGPGAILTGFTIAYAERGGVLCRDASPVISDNIISENGSSTEGSPTGDGGGIDAIGGNPTICENTIRNNSATYDGGGIAVGSRATIRDNWIYQNKAFSRWNENLGGGIYAGANAVIVGNIIEDNQAASVESFCAGSGVYGGGLIEDNTFVDNHLYVYGDGLLICSGTVRNNLFIDDRIDCYVPGSDPDRSELLLEGNTMVSLYSSGCDSIVIRDCIITGELEIEDRGVMELEHSDVVGGQAAISAVPPASFTWGPGMVSEDPLFAAGPFGDYYLSQTAAGQDVDSPCVDAGDPATEFPPGVTRTDGCPDTGIVDMGFHYPALGIVAAPGPSELNAPRIRLYSVGEYPKVILDSDAYGASGYGVNVALGDPDGDQQLEILTGPGPGEIYGPHVRGFELDGTPVTGLSFLAYGTHRFGVNVAAGDITGNGRDEIITGAGPGAVFGPHVRAFEYFPGGGISPMPGVSYFAYGTLKWGVNVAAGDIDGDGFDEIITGAGPGTEFGPHVRGWNVDGGSAGVIHDFGFLAYAVNRYGVNVCCADVNGDEVDEIITAPGPTGFFPSHIRGWCWDGTESTPLPGYSFFAWPPGEAAFGARVGRGADMDHDGVDELIVGGGPDPEIGTPVRVFRYIDGEVSQWLSFEAFPAGWTHGANAAGGWLH